MAQRLAKLRHDDVSGLAPADWQLICQYYGLLDHRPRKLRELGEATGQSPLSTPAQPFAGAMSWVGGPLLVPRCYPLGA